MAAGKISGKVPGSGGVGPEGSTGTADPAATRPEGSFADKLGGAKATDPTTKAAAGQAPAAPTGLTGDIAAELQAGRITPKAALDRVIDRIVDKQLGANAPAAIRQKVRAALEDAVADDPLLSEKIKNLGTT